VRDPQTRIVSLAGAALACLALVPGVAAASDPPASQGVPVTAGVAAGTAASTPPAASDPPAAAENAGQAQAKVQAAADDDPDLSPTPMQPDFYFVNLPTTLRLPKYKLAFRVTHRFTRPLNQGSFKDSLGDFFGLDSGAQIGLELRFAPTRGSQVGFYRTSDKTIDFFGSYNLLRSIGKLPISISADGAIEGTDNFSDKYSPSLGAVVTATLANRVAFTLVPTWVNNSNPLPQDLVDHNDTVYLGVGGRVRVTKRMYFVAEASPRLSGFRGGNVDFQNTSKYVEGKPLVSFGIEGQVGGHVFQLNVSNGFATTPANIARGAAGGKTSWYLGFNISRKFY
jgi:hypothetical protein